MREREENVVKEASKGVVGLGLTGGTSLSVKVYEETYRFGVFRVGGCCI